MIVIFANKKIDIIIKYLLIYSNYSNKYLKTTTETIID